MPEFNHASFGRRNRHHLAGIKFDAVFDRFSPCLSSDRFERTMCREEASAGFAVIDSDVRLQQQGAESMTETTLYQRLGGYDAISAVANDLLPRLQADPLLARFWLHRGDDGIQREKQLLIDFLCSSAGGPLYYTGRDMKVTHKGMKISESDWSAFIGHVNATLDAFKVPQAERDDVIAFVQSTKSDIVEA